MDYKDILEPLAWSTPSDYGGFSPVGDYMIAGRHRDSDLLEDTNYTRMLEDLQKFSKDYEADDDEPWVYDFRAGHWAVGWVEQMLVKRTAPEPVLEKVAEVVAAMADYPVYDEDAWCDAEHDACHKYWSEASVRERAEMCKEAGISRFAGRDPEQVPEECWDQLTEIVR